MANKLQLFVLAAALVLVLADATSSRLSALKKGRSHRSSIRHHHHHATTVQGVVTISLTAADEDAPDKNTPEVQKDLAIPSSSLPSGSAKVDVRYTPTEQVIQYRARVLFDTDATAQSPAPKVDGGPEDPNYMALGIISMYRIHDTENPYDEKGPDFFTIDQWKQQAQVDFDGQAYKQRPQDSFGFRLALGSDYFEATFGGRTKDAPQGPKIFPVFPTRKLQDDNEKFVAAVAGNLAHFVGREFQSVSWLVDLGSGEVVDGVFFGYACPGAFDESQPCVNDNGDDLKLSIAEPVLVSTLRTGTASDRQLAFELSLGFRVARAQWDEEHVQAVPSPIAKDDSNFYKALEAGKTLSLNHWVPGPFAQGRFDATLTKVDGPDNTVLQAKLSIKVRIINNEPGVFLDNPLNDAVTKTAAFWTDKFPIVSKPGLFPKDIKVKVEITPEIVTQANEAYFLLVRGAGGLVRPASHIWEQNSFPAEQRNLMLSADDLDYKDLGRMTPNLDKIRNGVAFLVATALADMELAVVQKAGHKNMWDWSGNAAVQDALDELDVGMQRLKTFLEGMRYAGGNQYSVMPFPCLNIEYADNAGKPFADQVQAKVAASYMRLVEVKPRKGRNGNNPSSSVLGPNGKSVNVELNKNVVAIVPSLECSDEPADVTKIDPTKITIYNKPLDYSKLYKTVYHEFGHTLGLIDDYFGTLNQDMITEQSLMFHPGGKGLPAFEQRFKADGEPDLQREKWIGDYAIWARTFGLKVGLQKSPSSAVMSAGSDIFKSHYIPFAMALCELYNRQEVIGLHLGTSNKGAEFCAQVWSVEDAPAQH